MLSRGASCLYTLKCVFHLAAYDLHPLVDRRAASKEENSSAARACSRGAQECERSLSNLFLGAKIAACM